MATTRTLGSLLAVLVAALVATLLQPPGPGQAVEFEPPGECAPTVDTASLESGMLGTGWTVTRGRTPTTFGVEILGVVTDGIAPGRDLIVVETSGPAVDDVGGIWYGMSGSPVFIDDGGTDRLVGALAFGFTFGPSHIAGLTPASDLLALAERPLSSHTSLRSTELETATLDVEVRREVAQREGVRLSEVDREMDRLAIPVALPAHVQRGSDLTERLRAQGERVGTRFIPYVVNGTARSATVSDAEILPGENFAGVLSYGDLTAAGIGTTSYVCDGRAVAFGHPFLFAGPTTIGANAATALRIVADPVFGPFKFATVAETIGVVDQDRLAGIRALLGAQPDTVPVTTSITALDDGAHRDGATEVVLGDLLPDLAFFHSLFAIDTTFDQITGGSAEVRTRISGTRVGDRAWTLETRNRSVSSFDVGFEALFEPYFDLVDLGFNDFEPVEITGVHLDIEVEGTARRYEVRDALVSTDGTSFVPAPEARLRAGRTATVRVTLRTTDRRNGRLVATPTEVNVDVPLEVPTAFVGPAVLEVAGGSGHEDEDVFECLFDPAACADAQVASFDDLLAMIEQRPRRDDLVVRLVEESDDDDFFDEWDVAHFDDGPTVIAESRKSVDRVASGGFAAPVDVGPAPSSKPAYVRGRRWRLRYTLEGDPADLAFGFGRATDIQLMCDWTGEGATPVVFRDGEWHARASLSGGPADRSFRFGRAGDIPVCGDWNGNGRDGPGLVRGRQWLLRKPMSRGPVQHEFTFGRATDVPVVGDWNGNGKDTPGRRSGSTWMLRNRLETGRATIVFDYGRATDVPVVGDWNDRGSDTVGVVRNGTWRLRNALTPGPAHLVFRFGDRGDRFLPWN